MSYKNLLFEIRDHVGWLTLNRPEKRNALNWEMMQELRDFFGSLDENQNIWIVVVRAAGNDFSVGMDLTAVSGGSSGMADQTGGRHINYEGFMFMRKLSDIVIRMRHAPQPIICAVRGIALGGGFSIALASDIRLGSETTRFNLGGPRIGLSAGDAGMSYFLPRLIGASRTALYMYTSRFIDAATAERIGLISEVVPDDKLDQATDNLITELLKVSPFVLRMNKEIYNASLDSPSLEDTTKLENRTQMLCGFTNDMIEAVSATFFEKRPPVYKDD